MIKLIAFDWNGTILADTKIVVNSDNHSLQTFGIEPVSVLEFQKKFCIPIKAIVQKLNIHHA